MAKLSQLFLSFNSFLMMPPGTVDGGCAERLDVGGSSLVRPNIYNTVGKSVRQAGL
jgi:hypothetical protein